MVYYLRGDCGMKLFDKYFQPYAEYCLRTTFSEDELKETLAKECPATSDVLSLKAIKAAFGLAAEGCTVPESVCGFTRYQAERVACRRFFFAQAKKAQCNGACEGCPP